ncbi:shootin-1 isoform X2 [Dendrobates tinctorius]|uniref:shootin-1 isoform X2 n=1 Tax=Dendrobates tinctorius TaxID=92724 RepID=UPI003CC95A8C
MLRPVEDDESRELRVLAGLKEQAIEKYEELKNENEKTKDEFDKVKQERDEAFRKLDEFSKISHLVIEEVSVMQNSLEIEKTCRESAEALAVKLNKENKNLKRISMMYMAKLGPETISKEISLDPDHEEDGGCTNLDCQHKLKDLQDQILNVEDEKTTISRDLEEIRSKLVDLMEEVNSTRKENITLNKETFDQRKLLEKYNRVSVLAVEEYEELQSSLEMEKDLRAKAESLAQEMYIEQSSLKRQSCLLLQSITPDQQLLKALDENARLTHSLEEAEIRHQLKVKELEEQLQEAKLRKEAQSLKKQLEILEEEKKDLECRVQSAETAVKDLKHCVDELQKRLHQAEKAAAPPPPPPPPPLPPPPPPNPIRSLMSIIRKKPSVSAAAVKPDVALQPDSENAGDLKRQAVEEMMDRIKRGIHLRPVQQTLRVRTQVTRPEPGSATLAPAPPAASMEEDIVDKPSGTAVQELREILDCLGPTPSRSRLGTTVPASTESELERILRRRKVTTEQDASAWTLSSSESKSLPVLGSALSQKARDTKDGGDGGQLLLPDEQRHTKVSSHSAETLGYADGKTSDEAQSSLNLQPMVEGNSCTTENVGAPDKRGKDADSSHC